MYLHISGGIGGVHRDGHITMDVSADLIEMGKTPVCVVCSGIKSILDIPRTLEYLETQGVSVASYGLSKNFPDFYTRDSGCKVPYNLPDAVAAAKLVDSLQKLELKSGILIGVPIPEEYAANKQQINSAIDEAYTQAHIQGVQGRDVTPFLLAAIAKITNNNSLQANMALIKNNAATAAQIAVELHKLQKGKEKHFVVESPQYENSLTPFVIGASILDLCITMQDDIPQPLNGATYNIDSKQSAGGVGRNLAEGIYKLHGSTNFLSIIGNDQLGHSLLNMMPSALQKDIHITDEKDTSLCSVIFDRFGDCKLVLGNMDIHEKLSSELILKHETDISQTPLIVIDANLPVGSIQTILELAQKYEKPVFFEPTDMRIAGKPFTLPSSLSKQIKFVSPNFCELRSIVQTFRGHHNKQFSGEIPQKFSELMNAVNEMLTEIQSQFDCILVTLGAQGVIVSHRQGFYNDAFFDINSGAYGVHMDSNHQIKYFPAPRLNAKIRNVSGAGDSFSSGFITGLLRGYNSIERCVALGSLAAARSLISSAAVPETFFRNHEEESKLLEKTVEHLQKLNT